MAETTWRQALADGVTRPEQLLALLELTDPILLKEALRVSQAFPLRVPKSFIARMQKGTSRDPLLRQVLPVALELEDVPGFTSDPLQEGAYNPIPAVLHKFHNRILLIVTAACAVHCRYCFRRHFPYSQNHFHEGNWDTILSYIQQQTALTEVILSGGDPLMMSDQKLSRFVTRLQEIKHVRYLRIHTRLPIMLPERVDEALLRWLASSRLKMTMVMHCNHPQEIDNNVAQAMQKLKQAGVTLLNQTVLLRHVNDSVKTLSALSERLFDIGVMPYYLFLLDKVKGAAHFEVPESQAVALYQALAARISGYLLPKLAREEPGRGAKRLIGGEGFLEL